MDEGINAVRNWYSLAADTVPEVYREQGYDNFNIQRAFEILFDQGRSTSSGVLHFNSADLMTYPQNLVLYSNWQLDLMMGFMANVV
jgi:hypothetical protein